MKLASFYKNNELRIGCVEAKEIVDLTDLLRDAGVAGMRRLLEEYGDKLKALGQLVRRARSGGSVLDLEGVKLGPPVPRPGKIICLGLNYTDHIEEIGAKTPDHPILFSKAPTAVIGDGDPIVHPGGPCKLDYEVELAVVVGRGGRRISEDLAHEHVMGYTILNDVTDRDAQFSDRQWFRGKSYDTFAPLGPWIVTRDEMRDTSHLNLKLLVNGEVRQDSNTSKMLFNIPGILAFTSRAITLEPGDIIGTGTPGGVGIFMQPPNLLKPGDVVEAVIEGIGTLRNPVEGEL